MKKTAHIITLILLPLAFASSCEKFSRVIYLNQSGMIASSDMKVTSITPLVAKPGDEVTVTGINLGGETELKVGDQAITWTSSTGTTAKFIMPMTPRPGAFEIKVGRYKDPTGVVLPAAKYMLSDSADDEWPIYMAAPDQICSPTAFRDAAGAKQMGTKNCDGVASPVRDCKIDGDGDCRVDGTHYKAADVANLVPGNIKSGVTIAGQEGSVTAAPAAPDAWDLRAGVTVGSVTGKLKVNCRNRANLTLQDMDTGRRIANVDVDNGVFTTETDHGLLNGQAVRFQYAQSDLAADPSFNNRTTYYVTDQDTKSFKISSTPSPLTAITTSGVGAASEITVHKWNDGTADVWDTIDDFNVSISGNLGTVVSGWSDNDCGGVESVAGDGNVWKDVTTSDGTTESSCASTTSNCTMKDKITGLWWSKMQSTGTGVSWWQAVNACQSLNHNGQTGWRLPTQKELMDAYNHGIRSAASDTWTSGSNTYWITESQMYGPFWSASSNSISSLTNEAWIVKLATGYTIKTVKSFPNSVVCVRP